MDQQKLFGNWLKQRRHDLDLTQVELAQLVGCSVVTIRKIEAGERRPSKPFAERLAKILGIPHDDVSRFIASARRGEIPLLPP